MNVRLGISLLAISAIHLVFLAVLFWGNSGEVGIQSAVIVSLIPLIVAYARTPKSEAVHSKLETILFPFIIAAAGVLTFYVNIGLHVGPAIASAGIGFVASYLTIFKSSFLKSLPIPIYCGTFIGMCSSFLTEDYFFVTYAGLVAGIIYILSRDALNGVGGKLGTIALGGVLIVSFIFSLL